jgi:hypothetical protein
MTAIPSNVAQETGIQKYLGPAMQVLQKLGISPREEEESRLALLLEDIREIDEPKVLAVVSAIRPMGTFNALVRDKLDDVSVADRYKDITDGFDSIRVEGQRMTKQYDDGKLDWKERLENRLRKLFQGSVHDKFESIRHKFNEVQNAVSEQLGSEDEILQAYQNYRLAVKSAEGIALDVYKKQEERWNSAQTFLSTKNEAVKSYQGQDAVESSRLELERDEAKRTFDLEDRRYQLMKDVTEGLGNSYQVGEVLAEKLRQTHELKRQVHQRSVTFFTTNEGVFTLLDANITAQRGLHEATQTQRGMREGINKSLEFVADIGGKVEKEALREAYGTMYNLDSVKSLVDAVVTYQTESRKLISQYRMESAQNTIQVRELVEEGKRRLREAIFNYTTPEAA